MSEERREENNKQVQKEHKKNRRLIFAAAAVLVLFAAGGVGLLFQRGAVPASTEGSEGAFVTAESSEETNSASVQTTDSAVIEAPSTEAVSTEETPSVPDDTQSAVEPPDMEQFDTIYVCIEGRLYYYKGTTYGMLNNTWGHALPPDAEYVGAGIKTKQLPEKNMEVRAITEPYIYIGEEVGVLQYFYYGGMEPEIYYSKKNQAYYIYDAPYCFKMAPWDEQAAEFVCLTEEERYEILFEEEFPALTNEQMRLWEERMEQYEPSEKLQNWICDIEEIYTENYQPFCENSEYDGQEQYQVYKWDGEAGVIRAEQVVYEILYYYDVLGKGEQDLYVMLDMHADEADRLTGLEMIPAKKVMLAPDEDPYACVGYVTVDTLLELCEAGYSTQIYLLDDPRPHPHVIGELNKVLTVDTALEARVCFFSSWGMYETRYGSHYYTCYDEETGSEMREIHRVSYSWD